MNDGMYLRICAIRKNNNGWEFSDYNGESLKAPDEKSIFTSSMNKRYRKERKKYIVDENTACVWFLRGKADNGDITCIQVDRTKNLTNLLSNDIKEDIKSFYSGVGKYRKLKEKYNELVFYDVNVNRIIKEDKDAKKIFGSKPKDNNLGLAYSVIWDAYVEGKLSFEKEAELYCPSTLDGYYYAYFKEHWWWGANEGI